MYRFLLSLKQPDGSFIMHEGGEVDVRCVPNISSERGAGADLLARIGSGCYCALTAAVLLNILTPDLASGTASFIASCQTYEGGLAAAAHPFVHDPSHPAPLGEAHGGYAFCAAASWSMLRVFSDPTSPCFAEAPLDLARAELDIRALLRWSAFLQAMPIEGGGFRGRTNKLVDGCYSWWCGGLFPIVDSLLAETDDELQPQRELFDRSECPVSMFAGHVQRADRLASAFSQSRCKSTSPSSPKHRPVACATSQASQPTRTTRATTSPATRLRRPSSASPPRGNDSSPTRSRRRSVAPSSTSSRKAARMWK